MISILKSQADLYLKCTDKKYLFVDFELYALKNPCLDTLKENECKLFEVYMFMTETIYRKLEAKAKSKQDEQKIQRKELDTITEAECEASILESGRTLISERTINEPDTP